MGDGVGLYNREAGHGRQGEPSEANGVGRKSFQASQTQDGQGLRFQHGIEKLH